MNLDAIRINRDSDRIANEVIQHLTALNGATVKITLEIEADIPDGVPSDVERTVTENCRTLKFKTQSFEQNCKNTDRVKEAYNSQVMTNRSNMSNSLEQNEVLALQKQIISWLQPTT